MTAKSARVVIGTVEPGNTFASQPAASMSAGTTVSPAPSRSVSVNVVQVEPANSDREPNRTSFRTGGTSVTSDVSWAARRSAPEKTVPLTFVRFSVAPPRCAPLRSAPLRLPFIVAPGSCASLRSQPLKSPWSVAPSICAPLRLCV